MAITWIPFNVAMKAQKNRLQVIPPRAFQEPYAGLGALLDRVVHLDSGLRRFLKGNWDVATFIFNYGIVNPSFPLDNFSRRLTVRRSLLWEE